MAISFVGSSNVSNGIAQGASAVVPKPGGTADGDLILAFVSVGNNNAITAPAGWTELSLGANFAGATLQNRIYWKIASSEPASWTWTFTSSAYVGIAHTTRGVGGIYAAQQADDGISLLSHTTPSLGAPNNAWLISSWTGRNLLALGWAPPAGDTERQDVIGGLLVLLNVNHAVDDTAGPVAAGTYSKTAATLIAVRALDALVVLAPTLGRIQLDALKSPARFQNLSVELGITDNPVKSPITFGSEVLELGITINPVKSPFSLGSWDLEFGITLGAILAPVTMGSETVSNSIDIPAIPFPALFGSMFLESNIILDPVLAPASIAMGSLEFMLNLDFQDRILSPLDFGTLDAGLQLSVPELLVPVLQADDLLVLPEQTLLMLGLPIPIIAGTGGILSVFRTTLAGDPYIVTGTRFGSEVVYQVVDPECCTTA